MTKIREIKEENGKINIPMAGEFYKCPAGERYQIIGRAFHPGTGEEMVVYQALFGEYKWYVQPLAGFCLERFLPGDGEEIKAQAGVGEDGDKQEDGQREAVNEEARDREQDGQQEAVNKEARDKEQDGQQEAGAVEQVRPDLLAFLDAKGAREKLAVLRQVRRKMDEVLLTNIELSLDIMPDERESMERRLDLVERTLEKRAKYEGGRLR